jgi:hypothetical protein
MGETMIRGAESGVCAGPRRVVEYYTTSVSRLYHALLPAAAATFDIELKYLTPPSLKITIVAISPSARELHESISTHFNYAVLRP